ncbi:nitrilotriacetate monooxygenase [Acinetobacter sp. ANC 4558]|uniref:LLM class flavin-dependent oxidoreductase n=1 Tax=Acinetobacter sp. ANC 4558 TaxID=1977876 RepID=UPI000A35259E|nr:LLM class flavin-dependent oxidoreductase [Acinetobacter sp. ANC 4558]OTG84187.1 nitrilotriacetate monooxygenase [Acinetobacter sp. ANC 4558]
MSRKIRLGAFIPATGQHVSAWRHPDASPERHLDINYLIEIAQTAERGLFDAYFLADSPAINFGGAAGGDQYGVSSKVAGFEPVTLFAALSTATQHIGFIATASTTYEEPYLLARKFASLDHISNGRAGWNVVTTASVDAAYNFGYDEQPEYTERYERAQEYVDLIQKLWDSWEDDAFVYNKETGIFYDVNKLHHPNHKGKYLSVKGALNVPRSPQGYPVVVQAGSSEPGRDLAARYAEVIFTAHQELENAQEFYRDVKSRLAKYGRRPEELLILPGVSIFVGKTEEEARAKYEELTKLIRPEAGLALLSGLAGGIDFSQYDLDAPFPDIESDSSVRSRPALIANIAKKNNFTIRQLYEWVAGVRGHWQIIGSVEQVVDQLQEWFENEAADGFNVLPPTTPNGLNDFVDLVVPELQRRGLFRTEYEGKTLRENLGLARPENQYVLAQKTEKAS